MARWKEIKKTTKRTRNQTGPSSKIKIDSMVVYAGFWPRFLALSVDVFMIGIPISILIYLLFGYESMQNQPGFLDAIEGIKPSSQPNPLIPFLTLSLWSIITLGFWYKTGQTPGKKMAKIIVVDNHTYQTASLLRLVVRLLFFIMPIFTFFSFLIMLIHPKKRTIHDMISRTAVIYERL